MILIVALCVISITCVHAQEATIYIDESPITVLEENIGELFNVTVRIQDVPPDPGAVGIEFKLRWNTSILEGVSMVFPPGHFMEPDGDNGNLWIVKNEINNTLGQAYYAVTFYDSQQGITMGYLPKSGNGILAVIAFNSTAPGETNLQFSGIKVGGPTPPTPPPVIETSGIDGNVTVIPEFPVFMVLLFMVATVSSVIFQRIGKNKTPNC